MTVWHYTSENALKAINKTKKFAPSVFKQTDTTYGPGWYVTNLAPSTPIKELCDCLWDDHSPATQEKTKAYVKLEINDKHLTYCRPHVYLLKLESVQDNVIEFGKIYKDKDKNLIIRLIEAVLNTFKKS
jgi:hypothetical protein